MVRVRVRTRGLLVPSTLRMAKVRAPGPRVRVRVRARVRVRIREGAQTSTLRMAIDWQR